MACDREGVDHLVALRVRVVAQRAYRTWGEKTGELILLAMDETGWLSLVGLTNRGFLGGADRSRPRVDWRDLRSTAMVYELRGICVKSSTCMMRVLSELSLCFGCRRQTERGRVSRSRSRTAFDWQLSHFVITTSRPRSTQHFRLWWASRLRGRRFSHLIRQAREVTQARISLGRVEHGEPGQREAMPYFFAVLRELVERDPRSRDPRHSPAAK